MDLRKFPMDTQRCPLTIESCKKILIFIMNIYGILCLTTDYILLPRAFSTFKMAAAQA